MTKMFTQLFLLVPNADILRQWNSHRFYQQRRITRLIVLLLLNQPISSRSNQAGVDQVQEDFKFSQILNMIIIIILTSP